MYQRTNEHDRAGMYFSHTTAHCSAIVCDGHVLIVVVRKDDDIKARYVAATIHCLIHPL